MPNFTVKDPPEYNDKMQMLEPTDPAHANKFNLLFETLLNNEAFLKLAAETLAETIKVHINSAIHVTAQDKQNWNAKASMTAATQSAAGLMSAADKKKLDGVAEGAEANQDAFSNVKVGAVTITANGKTATFILEAGDNFNLTADNATKKINIKSNRDGGNAETVDGYHAAHFAAADHGHDGRYYTKTESDNLLKQKAASSHSHTKASITDFPSSMPPTAHSHSDYAAKSIYGDSAVSYGRKAGTIVGAYSVAFGYNVEASGAWSYAVGHGASASGNVSHAEGINTIANKENSHAEGSSTTASGSASHAEGQETAASGHDSHAEGYRTTASGNYSHAEGYRTTASGSESHAEGSSTTASGSESHAEGSHTTASGSCSCSGGTYTVAKGRDQTVVGRHNKPDTEDNKVNNLFEVGCGLDSNNPSNAFRVTYSGDAYIKTAYHTGGADYAEFFEWLDKNPNAEDRVGYFVTLDNDKIRIADTEDYILGIVSGSPSVVGNSPEDWAGRWKKDKLGRLIKEISKIPLTTYEEYDEPIFDENGQETGEYEHKMREIETGEYMELEHPVAVDEYDSSMPYISRADRPEWAAVGMLGVLAVYDDGSCQVNGYCKVVAGGTATAADGEYTLSEGKIIKGYRVIERVADDIVKVVFR